MAFTRRTGEIQRTCVVTGGAGFIGSHVAEALLAHGDRVVVVDNLSGGRRSNIPAAALFAKVDVLDAEGLAVVADGERPDVWFHFAGQPDEPVALSQPHAEVVVHVGGTINVLEAARRNDAAVLYASTAAVYGRREGEEVPVGESYLPRASSVHAAAKLSGEQLVSAYAHSYGLRTVIARIANAYGPRQLAKPGSRAVATLLQSALAGEGATIAGNGSQTRDFVYVDDVAACCLLAAAAADPDAPTVNIGTGVPTSIAELWAIAQQIANVQAGIARATLRPGDVMHSAVEPTHARLRLGFRSFTPLKIGLARTAKWLRGEMSEQERRAGLIAAGREPLP